MNYCNSIATCLWGQGSCWADYKTQAAEDKKKNLGNNVSQLKFLYQLMVRSPLFAQNNPLYCVNPLISFAWFSPSSSWTKAWRAAIPCFLRKADTKTHHWPITMHNFLIEPQLATLKFVAWQVESEGGNTGNNAFNIQCNNVLWQVEWKCCLYYLTLRSTNPQILPPGRESPSMKVLKA